MNKCKNCGQEYEGKFCPNCGCPATEGESVPAADKVAVSSTKPDAKAKAAAIFSKLSLYAGGLLAALYGALSFLFLLGDFYTVAIAGTGVSCYDAIGDNTVDAQNYIIAIMVLALVCLIVAAIHMMLLRKQNNGKDSNPKTIMALTIVECVLILGTAITGCAAAGWLHGEFADLLNSMAGYDASSLIETGAGLNCVMAFGFIFLILIVAVMVANRLLSKETKATVQTAAQPAEEAAVAEDTPATAEETAEKTVPEDSSEKTEDKQ